MTVAHGAHVGHVVPDDQKARDVHVALVDPGVPEGRAALEEIGALMGGVRGISTTKIMDRHQEGNF